MKTLDITSQKTAVLDDKDSRNSIRPILEEAWFSFEYTDVTRTLLVLDGKEKIANIVWVKWIEDFRRRSRYIPISWVGSDVWEEIFWNRENIEKVLETWIWPCTLEYIIPQWRKYEGPLRWVDVILTKYPEYFKSVLFNFYKELIEEWSWAPEFSPNFIKVENLVNDFYRKVEYSDSPDTTLFDISSFWWRDKYAWWEVVQTWKSTDLLWLERVGDEKLIRNVSTDIYARKNIWCNQREVFDFFVEKIRIALKKS